MAAEQGARQTGWHKVRDGTRRIATLIMEVSAVSILVAMLLGTADVVSTRLFGSPVPGTTEGTGALMVLIVFGGLAYAQVQRSHIRATLVRDRMNAPLRSALDLLAGGLALLFFAAMAWRGGLYAYESWQIFEVTPGLMDFPLYPGKTVLTLGSAAMAVVLMVDTVDDLGRFWTGLRRGRWSAEGNVSDDSERR